MSNDTRKLIGVISDTHGLVRPQTLDALAGVGLILHARISETRKCSTR